MLTIGNLTNISLGWQGENNSRTVQVDVSAWLQQWPGATIDLLVQRPGEDEFYPADTKVENGILEWKLSRSDVQLDGEGKAQMVLTGPDGLEMRSRVVKTVIGDSIDGTEGDAPAPIESWVQEVLQAANAVRTAVDAGEGTLYLIQQKGSTTDRTYDEIDAAINAKKTCILTDKLGRVHLYSNRTSDGTLIFRAIEHGVPIGGGAYTSLTEREVHINKDGKVSNIAISPIKAPSPNALTIEQNGQTTTYDGTKTVNIKVEGGVPDPGKAHQQLVSDKDGKAVWEERLAYKHVHSGTMTLFAEETLMDDPEDPGMYFSATPLAAMPEVGKTYEVTINGTVYNTTAHPDEEDGVQFAVVLGNKGNLNPEVYPDTGEPFMLFVPLPEHQTMMGGMSVIMVTDIAADSITLSIKGQTTITDIKKIDPEYLPDTHKTITIMIDADGNVMCDTLFAEAWAMTTGELQEAIVIKESSVYKGTTYITADTVAKVENKVMGNFIDIRLRQGWIDTADFGDKDNVRYLRWRIDNQIVIDDNRLNALPIMTKSDALKGGYLRYNGKSWEYATIDQLKADIGHVTVRASQDGTLAISGIDKTFSEVLSALKAGAHVQLMLTRPDGLTEVYPAVGYADTRITFIMLPSHDTAWAIEWTESGMTKILSGND